MLCLAEYAICMRYALQCTNAAVHNYEHLWFQKQPLKMISPNSAAYLALNPLIENH